MIYVMSDIHGCYDKYIRMLEKISFSNDDTLYILGDIVDRGPFGIKMLLDIEKHKNVIFLRGNHDQQAGILLSNLYMLDDDKCPKELVELYKIWIEDGGKTTLTEYLLLSQEEQMSIIEIISNSLASKEIKINGKEFILSHTVPKVSKINEYEQWTLDDYILGEPDYEKVYFDNKYIVTGHTPTEYIDKKSKGKIWIKNNHIAIDCGAVYGNPLGCLCLNTYEEFYVI